MNTQAQLQLRKSERKHMLDIADFLIVVGIILLVCGAVLAAVIRASA